MLLSVKEHEMHHRGQLMLIERQLGIVPHLTREREARFGVPAQQPAQESGPAAVDGVGEPASHDLDHATLMRTRRIASRLRSVAVARFIVGVVRAAGEYESDDRDEPVPAHAHG